MSLLGIIVGVSAGPCTSIIVAGHKRAVNLLRGNENEEVKDGAFDTAEIVALDFELRAVLELVLLFGPVRFVTCDRFVPNPAPELDIPRRFLHGFLNISSHISCSFFLST
jgi:hypothetical protein